MCIKTVLTVRKLYVDLEEAAFPDCLVFAGNAAVPGLEIEDAGLVLLRFGEEAEGVIFAPLLPVVDQLVHIKSDLTLRKPEHQIFAECRAYLSSCNRFWQSDMMCLIFLMMSSGCCAQRFAGVLCFNSCLEARAIA